MSDALGNALDSRATAVADLTVAMSTGDTAAVEAFYRRYFEHLYVEARRATRRDEAFCLDVVHDAVLRIVRTIRPVGCEAQLLAWLKLVVRTTALDLLRSEKRRQKRELAIAPITAGEMECGLERDEQMQWLGQQIARLDPEIVRLIELRFVKEWTLQRMARWLGLSIGTIDGRLRRALASLRDAAKELEDE